MVTDLRGSMVSISPSRPTVSMPPVLAGWAEARCVAGALSRDRRSAALSARESQGVRTVGLPPFYGLRATESTRAALQGAVEGGAQVGVVCERLAQIPRGF